jgi:hypothetical protein
MSGLHRLPHHRRWVLIAKSKTTNKWGSRKAPSPSSEELLLKATEPSYGIEEHQHQHQPCIDICTITLMLLLLFSRDMQSIMRHKAQPVGGCYSSGILSDVVELNSDCPEAEIGCSNREWSTIDWVADYIRKVGVLDPYASSIYSRCRSEGPWVDHSSCRNQYVSKRTNGIYF